MAAAFERAIASRIEGWRDYFAMPKRPALERRDLGLGLEVRCVSSAPSVSSVDEEVATVTDVNPYRHGKFLVGTGKEIVPPQTLVERSAR